MRHLLQSLLLSLMGGMMHRMKSRQMLTVQISRYQDAVFRAADCRNRGHCLIHHVTKTCDFCMSLDSIADICITF